MRDTRTIKVLCLLYQSVSSVASRQHLRSASQGFSSCLAIVSTLSSYGPWAFSVASPAIWNWLPDSLRDPAISRDSFKRSLKTFNFQLTRVQCTLQLSGWCALQIYLLTYLLNWAHSLDEGSERCISVPIDFLNVKHSDIPTGPCLSPPKRQLPGERHYTKICQSKISWKTKKKMEEDITESTGLKIHEAVEITVRQMPMAWCSAQCHPSSTKVVDDYLCKISVRNVHISLSIQ